MYIAVNIILDIIKLSINNLIDIYIWLLNFSIGLSFIFLPLLFLFILSQKKLFFNGIGEKKYESDLIGLIGFIFSFFSIMGGTVIIINSFY